MSNKIEKTHDCKSLKQSPIHGRLSLMACLLCGLMPLGTSVLAGSLYWDSGAPNDPNDRHARRHMPQSPVRELERNRSTIDSSAGASMTAQPEQAMKIPSSEQPARTVLIDETTPSTHDPSSIAVENAPSIDATGIVIDQQIDKASKSKEQELHHAASEEDDRVRAVVYDRTAFRSDPVYQDEAYDADAQILIYGGKTEVATQRPIPEIGRPLYDVGPLDQGVNLLGQKNLIFGHLYGFGDWRTAVALNNNGDQEITQIATRLNLDLDLGLTATERLHALLQPLQKDGAFTRCEFGGDDAINDCELELDFEPQTLFFEGDLAAIAAGVTDSYASQDLPVTGGLIPLLFQNGIWVEDAFWGGAASMPAMNSRELDISNADVTAFVGFDEVNANGVVDASGKVAESNVNIYGIATFIEALEGYIEAGYGYVDAEDNLSDQDYHSATVALTRRYGGKISNSVRLVGSFGQDRDQGKNQNGLMVLVENSLVTSKPYQLVPYANFFVGIDRPVPLARQNGILKNTGISFESDALTGFPFLDDTGQNAYGGALGVEYLFDLDQQIVVEVATARSLDDISSSRSELDGDQYAISARYQLPLNNAWLLRADAIYGLLRNDDDLAGIRTELRFKF